jgi:hypothetical protein
VATVAEVWVVRRDGEDVVNGDDQAWVVEGIVADRHKKEVGWATVKTRRWAPVQQN